MKSDSSVALIILIVGCIIAIWRMKRKFDRTNVFGQEQFSSFFEKLTMKANDILIGGLALVFIITGGLTLALIYQNTWGWIFILIACVFYPVLLFVL